MVSTIDQVNTLLAQLQSPDFYEREEAVQQLGRCDTTEAVAGLVIALEDADMGIREMAADLLCNIKGDIAAQLLIKFLAHGDIGTRNLAAEILVRFGGEAVPALIAEIENDDHDVRKFIVDVLGMIGDERSTGAICGRLHDSNINVVCSAAEALGEIGSSATIPELVEAYRRTPDVRLQAVEALGKIGDPSTLQYLIEFLGSDDPVVLYAAIEALGNLNRQESVDHLIRFLEYPDSTIAEAALAAIIHISINNDGRIGHDLPLDKFSEFLFEGIRNRDPRITKFTLGHLSHWYGSKVVQSLLDVVAYVEDDDLKRIVEILAQIGPSASDLILRKFPESSTSVKLVLLNILKQYVDENIARSLLPFTKDTDPDVRQNIAFTLGLSACPEAVVPLRALAKDSVGHVRSAAYAALGWLCTEDDIDIILEGLYDRYPDVREAA
ncbi:MAG TPA: HEAT repeat domain-containing protein, partial [candidate division Zixibacteria bacterium]|nr:HEAT repeat domain-containing protein [candidate division Zixibacteria bacterium]